MSRSRLAISVAVSSSNSDTQSVGVVWSSRRNGLYLARCSVCVSECNPANVESEVCLTIVASCADREVARVMPLVEISLQGRILMTAEPRKQTEEILTLEGTLTLSIE